MSTHEKKMSTSTTTSRRYWTEQEDYILESEALLQIAEKGMVNNWSTIAAKLRGSRTNKDCRKRWTKIGSSGNKGQWTAEEDERLRRSVAQHGHCWSLVTQIVQTRHTDQYTKHWLHFLDPNLSHERWSSEEDETLLNTVQTYGTSWKIIRKKKFPNQSSTDLKNRYIILSQRQKNIQGKSISEPSPSSNKGREIVLIQPSPKEVYTPSSTSIKQEPHIPNASNTIAGDTDANFMFSFQPPMPSHDGYTHFSDATDITDDTTCIIPPNLSKFDDVMDTLEPSFDDCFLEASLSSIHHHDGGSSGHQNMITSAVAPIVTDISPSHSHSHSQPANGLALNIAGHHQQDDTRYTLVLEDVTGDNLQKLTNQLFRYQMPVKMRITSTGS